MENKFNFLSLFSFNLIPQEKDIYLFDISTFENDEALLKSFISDFEINQANKIIFSEKKYRFIIKKCIIRIVLSYYLNIEPQKINFLYGRYNKPFVNYKTVKLNFNISHSDQYLLIGVNSKYEIGVDIETVRSISKRKIDLFDSYFSKNELILFNRKSYDQKVRMFHRIWVQKEAISKALGYGLNMDFSQIDLSESELNIQNIFEILKFGNLVKVKKIEHPEYMLSIATI